MKACGIVCAFLLFPVSAFAQETRAALKPFLVLVGKWKSETDKGAVFEEWSVRSRGALAGKSYRINLSGDTTFLETMVLRLKGKSVYYIPTVTTQNDAKPVTFQLVKRGARMWVFENAFHDFPQQIVYSPKGSNALLTWIEGKDDGSYSKISSFYTRTE